MILDKFQLHAKVALVTGASRGLGKAAAIGLAEAGADLALVGTKDTNDTATQVSNLGRRVCQIKADLLERSSVASGANAATATVTVLLVSTTRSS